jgi:hypothetical protein
METKATPLQDMRAAFNIMRQHKRLTAAIGIGIFALAGLGYGAYVADQNVRQGAVTGIANKLMAIKAHEHTAQALNAAQLIKFQNTVSKEVGKFLVMGDAPDEAGKRCFSVDAQQGGVHGKGERPELDSAGRPSYESKMLKVCIPKAQP